MATEKPRYSITVDEEMLEAIERYRFENKIATRSQATIELVETGIEELRKQGLLGNDEEKDNSAAKIDMVKKIQKMSDNEVEAVLAFIESLDSVKNRLRT